MKKCLSWVQGEGCKRVIFLADSSVAMVRWASCVLYQSISHMRRITQYSSLTILFPVHHQTFTRWINRYCHTSGLSRTSRMEETKLQLQFGTKKKRVVALKVPKSIVEQILKLGLKFHPYNIQVVQAIMENCQSPRDFAFWIVFCMLEPLPTARHTVRCFLKNQYPTLVTLHDLCDHQTWLFLKSKVYGNTPRNIAALNCCEDCLLFWRIALVWLWPKAFSQCSLQHFMFYPLLWTGSHCLECSSPGFNQWQDRNF